LGQRLKASPKDIHANVIGEHGDSEFVPWSSANFSMQKITDLIGQAELDKIETTVKNAAYNIIAKKGVTHYGIGMCMARITEAILGDENAILPVSNFNETAGLFIGMPATVGRTGVKGRAHIKLSDKEQKRLDASIEVIKTAVKLVVK
jgi:L-lactate dehydrogenase